MSLGFLLLDPEDQRTSPPRNTLVVFQKQLREDVVESMENFLVRT